MKNNKRPLIIVSIIIILMICAAFTSRSFQNDTFYTIKVGESIVKNGIDMKDHFSIPFINRLDDVVVFNQLTEENIRFLIKNKIKKLKAKYKKKDVEIKITNHVIDEIIKLSDYEEFGARKLDKIIKDKIENVVIENIINNKFVVSIRTLDEKMIV